MNLCQNSMILWILSSLAISRARFFDKMSFVKILPCFLSRKPVSNRVTLSQNTGPLSAELNPAAFLQTPRNQQGGWLEIRLDESRSKKKKFWNFFIAKVIVDFSTGWFDTDCRLQKTHCQSWRVEANLPRRWTSNRRREQY